METELHYGKQEVCFSCSQERLLGVLTPNHVEIVSCGTAEVERGLNAPIGKPLLENCVKAGQKVCIVTSDITRPMPSKSVLPSVIKRLVQGGIREEDIFIVFALGSHRAHTEEEKIRLVGEDIYRKFRCLDSSERQVTYLGKTQKGTEVSVFTPVVEADFRICMGNIEYHYFAGYSGGSKAIMPGVSTREAIRQNHSMMVDGEAYAGNLNSPVRKDIDEVCEKLLPIDYIVNVVLDEHKQIIRCVAGDYISAHREGCKFLDQLYKIEIRQRADIVVVSAGGYPKDQNMYQAQKALDNAKHAVRDGGILIWLAECGEGFGSALFEEWMTQKTAEEMPVEIRKNFVLGGHKAAAIALVMQRCRIFFVSSFADKIVEKMGFTPFKDVKTAFEEATRVLGEDSTVYVMPYGGSTLPHEE